MLAKYWSIRSDGADDKLSQSTRSIPHSVRTHDFDADGALRTFNL